MEQDVDRKRVSYFQLFNAVCPLCGKDFSEGEEFLASGHVRMGPLQTLTFLACQSHFEEAKKTLKKRKGIPAEGYVGEWEDRLGLMVDITYEGEENFCNFKRVL